MEHMSRVKAKKRLKEYLLSYEITMFVLVYEINT